jgi:hypothetical protein
MEHSMAIAFLVQRLRRAELDHQENYWSKPFITNHLLSDDGESIERTGVKRSIM